MGQRRVGSSVSRAIAAALSGILLGVGLTVVSTPPPAAAAAPLACLDTVYFIDGTAANVRRLDLTTGETAATPVFATPATAGVNTNQLGVGAGGRIAITGTSTSVVEYAPEASAAGVVTTAPKTAGVGQGTMGAINPLTGLYYYGGFSGATVRLYVYDPVTDAAPAGPVVTVNTPNNPGGNGDIAFDKTGRLYVVSGSATQAALYVAEGVVPTSGTGTILDSRELSRGATSAVTNGIAFGSDGHLYLGGPTALQKTNPITGAPTGTTFALSGVSSTDLGSCSNPSSAETAAEFDGPRAQPSDTTSVVLEGGSYGTDGTGPDFPGGGAGTGGSDGPSDPGLIIPGETYTLRQEAVGTTDLDDYTTTWTCTDGAGAVVASGSGNTASFTAPAGTDGANIVCRFVNVLPPPVAVADAEVGIHGAPIALAGATNDQPGTGAILPEQTVFTDPAATDGGKRLQTGDGVWTIGSDGRILFTPASGFSGEAVTQYRITDDNGQSSTADATATVRPGPTAGADASPTRQGESVQIPVLGNDAPGQNADGTPGSIAPASVVFTASDQPPGAVVSTDGRRIEVPGEGVYTVDPTTGVVTFEPEPTFVGPAASPVAYRFTDSVGNPATGSIQVSVTAVGPTAVDDAETTPHATTVIVEVLANDTEGPGGMIDPSAVVFTDPAAVDGGTLLETSQGTWGVNPAGQVDFTPAAGFVGVASTQYRIVDVNGQTATATVSVQVGPGPTANPDSASTAQNVDVSFPVLGNDVPSPQADGSAGEFDEATLRFLVTPALPAGSAVTANGRVLTVPGQGVYTFDPATARVSFDPAPAFTGAATPVTYTVSDSFGNSASSTVSVTVGAITPVAIDDAAKTPGGVAVTLDVLANDQAGAESAPLDSDSVVFTAADATDGGATLVVAGEGTWTVRDDGSVRFAPVPGFTGQTTPVTYQVADENGTTATAEIVVTVGRGAVGVPDSETTRQNTPVLVDILANDIPSDSGRPCDPGETDVPTGCDSAQFDPTSSFFPGEGQPAGAVVSDGGTTLTVPGQGVYSVDPSSTVTFTPEPAFTGVAASVVYQGVDSNGVTASSTITITVGPVIPVARDDSESTAHGTPVAIGLLADDDPGDPAAPLVASATTFPAAGQPSGAAISPDGKTLTIDGQGTFVLDDAGTAIFTPADGFSGTTTPVLYRITDTNGTTAEARVDVTVRPGPAAVADADSTPQGIAVTVQPLDNDTPSRNADDSDGSWAATSVRFPTAGQPGGAEVLDGGTRLVVPDEGAYTVGGDGSVTFTPSPQFRGAATPIVYSATDTVGNGIVSTIAIEVVPVVPVAADDTAATPFATPVTFDVAGDDEPGHPSIPLDPTTLTFEPSGIPAGVTGEIRDGGTTLDIAGEGVYTLADDGTVTFVPATGFTGDTTPVRYTIRDANGTAATAALSVTVRPGPAATPDVGTTRQNTPVTVDVLDDDTAGQLADGTSGALDTASVVFPPTGQPPGATPGDGGKTLVVPGQGEYAIEDDGRITFTPEPAFRGEALPVTYTVTDSLGNTATAAVTVTVTGVDPVARDDSVTASAGIPVEIDVVGNDSAGDDTAALDRDSVRIIGADGAPVSELTVPGEGVWRVDDGSIVFTPAPGFTGTTSPIVYAVADANGTRATASVTVTIVSGAPPVDPPVDPPTAPPATGTDPDSGGNAALPTTGAAVPWAAVGCGVLLLLGGIALLRRRRPS
ncbi:tandem-95 repeat protein [Microbacterium sp. 179-I 3D2 NHS]|uniref:Ig-like domain-containing protein n=1 Tax=Microbacterium sp. 179-I 3D2 NHS TaxID=3235178 RepID=UPI0039A06036